MPKAKRLILVDGSHLLYRSFFAFIRNPLLTSSGRNVSAAYGFSSSMLKLIQDEAPDYVAVVFDTREPTARHRRFPDYKATREKMPDEMSDQIPLVRELVDALGIALIDLPQWEADDVIGALADQAARRGLEVVIFSGDKDMGQLVNQRIALLQPRPGGTNERMGPKEIESKFGVAPERLVELLSLTGDSSDNIPGVPGVGPKTAAKLLSGASLDELLADPQRAGSDKLAGLLAQHAESVRLARDLIRIDCSAPIQLELERLARKAGDQERLRRLFAELEFTSLLNQLTADIQSEAHDYRTVTKAADFDRLLQRLEQAPRFALAAQVDSGASIRARVLGVSLALKEGEAFHLALDEGELANGGRRARLGALLGDPQRAKLGQDLKRELLVLENEGMRLSGLSFDPMIAAFLLEPGDRQHSLDFLALKYLSYKRMEGPAPRARGRGQRSMLEDDPEQRALAGCEDADLALRLERRLGPELERAGLSRLFREVEMPLIAVLAAMERTGVLLDVGFLKAMSRSMERDVDRLRSEITRDCGEEFNLNSPQQLARILFERLEIHKALGKGKPRRTKSGAFSTDAALLERYAEHPIIAKLFEYRQWIKLKSTYVDALPALVDPKSGRLHTSYNQTVAVTGRLSSSDPNLQNIPIRTEAGREIRRAFIAAPGTTLLAADYSQIELRILAHLSQDPALIAAFAAGDDIHRRTAARMFGVEPDAVSREMRSRAKTINFGIVYGMNAYGLSSRLAIPVDEAHSFIQAYFEVYPGVRAWIEATIARARLEGQVTTLLGRRRTVAELGSSNQRVRQAAENTAVNTPVQGSAADMIKSAMVRIHAELERRRLRSRMILQVHDELVFEAAADEVETVRELAQRAMQSALELSVPIVVDIGVGPNWLEAH